MSIRVCFAGNGWLPTANGYPLLAMAGGVTGPLSRLDWRDLMNQSVWLSCA